VPRSSYENLNDKSKDKNYIAVSFKCKNEFVEEVRSNPTREVLRKKDYNSEVHCGHSWQ
jgi:hypothetical protein